MGSLSLVTSELTSPIKEISLQLFLLISPVRRNNFTMFDSPQMQRASQRPVSWVNIPITRTVNNIMANVVEELKQQQQHEQQQPQQSPKRVRWSEELTQVRDISPRHKSSPFRFVTPHRNRSASPSRSSSSSSSRPSKSSLSSTQLHCSPQMQKVVFRAVNNNNNESNNNNNHINYWDSPTKTDSWRLNNNSDSSWRPDRSSLSLNIRPTFV